MKTLEMFGFTFGQTLKWQVLYHLKPRNVRLTMREDKQVSILSFEKTRNVRFAILRRRVSCLEILDILRKQRKLLD